MATSAVSGAVIRSQLRTGLDIVISGSPELIVQQVTQVHCAPHEPLIVLMPSDHHLTAHEVVRPQDLVGEIFIAVPARRPCCAPHRRLSPPLGARHQTGSRG
ncbi:MAG: LysR substrate-binding domain-containing protein [Pseudonocardiaceae bacterium]